MNRCHDMSAEAVAARVTMVRDLIAFAARGGRRSVQVPAEPLTESALCDWILGARVGDAIQYHQGLLLRDRSEVSSDLPEEARLRLHTMARRAWICCELGLVHLFSIRAEAGRFRYLAIRSGGDLNLPALPTRRRRTPADTRVPVSNSRSLP